MSITHVVAKEFDERIIDVLVKSDVINHTTWYVLDLAKTYGGYIAGGFAATLCRQALQSARAWAPYMKKYLGDGLDVANYHSVRTWWKRSNGDIDLWFPTEELSRAFLNDLLEKIEKDSSMLSIITEQSPGKLATELVCFGGTGTRGQIVQAITKIYGAPQSVTGNFDVYNAACYIDGEKLMVPEEWTYLNDNKLIHLLRWQDHGYMFQRLSKWRVKHGYDGGLTPASNEIVNCNFDTYMKQAEDAIEHAKNNDAWVMAFNEYSRVYGHPASDDAASFMRSHVEPLIPCLSGENLLKLSLRYGREDNPAMQELVRRADATLQQKVA